MKNSHHCIHCESTNTTKRGVQRGVQIYFCKTCKRRFSGSRRKKDVPLQIYFDYVFGKQTLRELSRDGYGSKRSIKQKLDDIALPVKVHKPREVWLLMDVTYFGKRIDGTSWGILVARDYITRENLYWSYCEGRERDTDYLKALLQLQQLGYTIASTTCDGLPGLSRVFSGIPFQYCQIHMERLCIMYLTRKSKEAPLQELLLIVYSLKESTRDQFQKRLHNYITKWNNYINERYSPSKGHPRGQLIHRKVHIVIRTLLKHFEELFIYETHKNIPKDTNALEGHFSHVKAILKIHRGMSKQSKRKALSAIMLASTIAPENMEFLK